jgi:hypothetical protein
MIGSVKMYLKCGGGVIRETWSKWKGAIGLKKSNFIKIYLPLPSAGET